MMSRGSRSLAARLLPPIGGVAWRVIQHVISLQPDPDAKPNLNPIQAAPPEFVSSTSNGKLYTVGHGDDMISLVHVWGEWCTAGREWCMAGRECCMAGRERVLYGRPGESAVWPAGRECCMAGRERVVYGGEKVLYGWERHFFRS